MSCTNTYYDLLDGLSRPLLELNDRLREILQDEEIRLPTIAVIGSQSAGKTSILERLSGNDLPRGAGMVTRCALEMQLKHQDIEEATIKIRYGDKSFETIKQEDLAERIRTITEEIAPGKKICTDKKIFVEVISRHVQDLTVVDLPGLAYSDDTGGVRDVYHRIKTLYKQYIEDKHCVIACVVTATEDVNSQEAYTIAKEADPLMKRTIGVITKIDRIEAAHGRTIVQRLQGQGDNAWNFLLGTHAVRNRTQDEINSGASREDVDKAEEEFFATHDYLSRVSAEEKAAMLGFSSLERKLVVVQSRIIKDALPGIERRIRQTLAEKNKELDALPPCVATDAKAQEVLRQLTGQLRECFQTLYVVDYSMIKSLDLSDAICPEDLFAVPSNAVSDMSTCSSEMSSADVDSDGISTSVPDWLKMMPRIQGVLEEFEEEIRCAGHHIMTQGYAEKVRKELKDVVGYTLPDLKTESALESLASSEIGAFKKPTQDMLDKVHTYVSALCSVVVRKIFVIYHQLSDHVLAVVETMLEESLEKCREQLSVLLSIERGEPYTLNHYYSDTVTKVMARCDEVTIGETHQPSEAALQIISEGRTIAGTMSPVTISGTTGTHSSRLNGVFAPTMEIFGGQVVYQKQGDPDTWLEYRPTDTQWAIVTAAGRGGKSGVYAWSKSGNSQLCGTYDWGVGGATQSLTLCQKPTAVATEPLHNNFERCVKETQIRLWCYRKVVHKAFCDTMAKFVRHQFPRRLKNDVETVIHKSLQVDAENANGSSSLLALMAETEELSRMRKVLQTSVRKHDEALKVMLDVKKGKPR